jgi:hypothetical protein
MSNFHVDKTAFTSQTDTYQIFDYYIVPILVSGTVATGTTKYYAAQFTFIGGQLRANTMIRRADTGLRALFNAGTRISDLAPTYEIFQFADFETVSCQTRFISSDVFQVALLIQNDTGSPITLVNQEIDILIEFYFAPID